MSADHQEYDCEGDEGEWEVDEILGRRKNTVESEYKVLWAGCTEGEEGATSWELKSWLEEEGYEDMVIAFDKLTSKERNQREQHRRAMRLKDVNNPEPVTAGESKESNNKLSLRGTSAQLGAPSSQPKGSEKKKSGSATDAAAEIPVEVTRTVRPGYVPKARNDEPLTAAVEELMSQAAAQRKGDGEKDPKVPPAKHSTEKAADAYVNFFETTFLRGNLIDPSIMRLLGSASWDVRKAWSEQQEMKSYTERASSNRKTTMQGEDGKEDEQIEEGEDREEEDFYDDADGENMFMIAPTTFFESADILLVIMSFSVSRDFFSACSVSKRWHLVGIRMGEGRALVRNFCRGMQKTLTCSGLIPIALASAQSPPSLLKRVYRQAKEELSDPEYDGRNGGALVPLHSYEIDEKKSESREGIWKPSRGGTASVLDPAVFPLKELQGDPWWPNHQPEVRTLCLSVGRLPTRSSRDRVELHSTEDSQVSFVPLDAAFQTGRPTHIRYGLGHTHLAVPVLYIRIVILKDRAMCQRLCNANESGWISEISKSLTGPNKTVRSVPKAPTVAEGGESKMVLLRRTSDDFNDDVDTEEALRMAREAEEYRIKKYGLNPDKRAVKQHEGKAEAAIMAPIWQAFMCSLPPPKLLWKSFVGVKAPGGASEWNDSPENWFKPPSTTSGRGRDEVDCAITVRTKENTKTGYSVLTHDEVVEKMKLASPYSLMGNRLPNDRRMVLDLFTDKFKYY